MPSLRCLRRHGLGLLALSLVATVSVGFTSAARAAAPVIPTAHHVGSIPTLGPLFGAGTRQRHTCTASVVHSTSRDLVLTAAHCVSGTGAGIQFVPGYNHGVMPYGVWTAVQAYVDPLWKSRQDPRHDVAILKMRRQVRAGHLVGVEAVVGGNILDVTPPIGTRMRVPAYAAGINDSPIICTNSTYRTSGYLSFDCHSYVGGTSGAPFVRTVGAHQVVAGVIGGLHQGGCFEQTSYSSPFGADTKRILARAVTGLHADVLPRAGSAGC